MKTKKECVAMLLAGGQGSRLFGLTRTTAKPALSFGGKYRIIDFPLSNCINSGIDTVGVLTQYRPLYLNDYIGTGLNWDLDRRYGGVQILPPYQRQKSSDWYKGTANAIWQNMEFINRYDADYVLVLSGDHIYKMDYSKLLDFHKKTSAECTIAVIDVPENEAHRFGIMSLDSTKRITKFEEKPKKPESNKASMGIYVFNKKILEEYLSLDSLNKNSEGDFGKNVIPSMLNGGEKLYAYEFSGYWKDVGTIDSLWEANMDLLGSESKLRLNDDSWRIYSRQYAKPPQYISTYAQIINSTLTAGCSISGKVKNSVLGYAVTVEEGAEVIDSVIMDNVRIKKGAKVFKAIVDANVTIEENSIIGEENKITVIEKEEES